MVRMFELGRFDTMIVNDKTALESALKKYGISSYAYAAYKFPRKIGNFYGISPNHSAKNGLQKALEDMVKNGQIDKIYSKYGIKPPLH